MKSTIWIIFGLTLCINSLLADSSAQTERLALPIPVQIVTALSCPHCRDKADELKGLIEKYSGLGEITGEYVDYPTDLATLIATKLSWSRGAGKRYELYRKFLARQDEWHNKDWREKLKKVAQELDLTEDEIQKAFENDTENEKEIVARMQKIVRQHNLQFVPALIINHTHVVDIDEKSLRETLQKIKTEEQEISNKE